MNRLRPVHSIKHIVDAQGGTVANTKEPIVIAEAKENPLLANATDVNPGCKIFSLFVNIQVLGTGGAGVLNNMYAIFYKNPQGNIASVPKGNATGINDFKRQIFHTEMLMLADSVSNIPQTLFKGVLKIPKVFHTMRIGDVLEVQLLTPGVTSNYCFQSIYKTFD